MINSNSDDFVKTDDGIVINNNEGDYERFRMARNKAMQERSLADRVNKLENELKQVKKILLDFHSKIG